MADKMQMKNSSRVWRNALTAWRRLLAARRLHSCVLLLAAYLLLICTGWNQCASATPLPEPYFESIPDGDTIEEGVVTSLAQDEKGLLWIGTQKGLLRFDGYRLLKIAGSLPPDTRVVNDFITALAAGKNGQLAMGSASDGLLLLNTDSGKIERYYHDPGQENSISAGTIWCISADAAGGWWIGTDQGLDYLAPGKKTFTHYRHQAANEASLLDNRVRSLLIDRKGQLWVGSAEGLQRMRSNQLGFERMASGNPGPDSLAGQEVRALFEAADGKLWLGLLREGAAWLEPDSASPQQLHRLLPDPANANALSHGWVVAIAQAQADQIWLGTAGGGINIVNARDGKLIQHVRADPGSNSSLAHDTIVPLLRDRAGLMWVGSWGGGLQHGNPQNRMVRAFWRNPVRPPGSNLQDARAMLERRDGSIVLGSIGNGVKQLDLASGTILPLRSGGNQALQNATILTLAEGADGTLWAGTKESGVWRWPPGATDWQTTRGLPGHQVNKLLFDRRGDLWAATGSGVARWRRGSGQFETLDGLDGNRMWAASFALAEDRQGRIWVGSDLGLWLLEPGTSQLHNIRPQPGRADALADDLITGLLVDAQDQLWVASAKGLQRLQRHEGKIAHFVMASNHASGANLLQDAQGRIWTGEFVLEPASMRLYPLSKADGFDIGTNPPGAFAATRNGLFMYGGTQGLVLLDPARFQPWQYQPPLVATALRINDKPAPLAALYPALQLTQGQRDVVIEFAALDYSDPQKNRYRYRLQGYDRDWIRDPERRSASYGNLPPGEYTLLVEGSNRYGEFSSQQLVIPVRVIPALWQTAWFRVLATLGLIALTFGGFRWRVAHLRSQSLNLQKLIDARTADILRLSQIGQELTATLDIEQTLERVYNHVRARLDAHVFRIGIVDQANTCITFVYEIENSVRSTGATLEMAETERPAVWCVRERRELHASQRSELLNFVKILLPPRSGHEMETIVYLPLLVEQRVVGCLSVQSPRSHAYNKDQIEFLRVLASYTAIAVSNSNAHSLLAAAHRHLQDTQAQLVQSEKMASLGQLIANVAHEINNPIGAVKASGSNIQVALEQTLLALPHLYKLLTPAEETLFQSLINRAKTPVPLLSSREERSITRQVTQELERAGVNNAQHMALILTQVHAQDEVPTWLPLLLHPQADFILETAHGIAAIISNTGNINLAVAKVSKIVFALSSYSRNSQGGGYLETPLRDGIETVLTIYQSQIKTGIELVREFEEVPPVRCRPDELNQVWTNLIHNALQAMNYHGTLSIGLHRRGDEVVVSVSDTGCGIEPALREKIFEAFFTTKPIGEGSGLGLDIVKKIISKHHGKIEVESEVGVGTTFFVVLPINTTPE